MKKPKIFHSGLSRFCVCLLIISVLPSGCGHLSGGGQAKAALAQANDLFHQGNYTAALDKYSEIIENHPAAADRALFEMGVAYAYKKNRQKDHRKSLNCFQRLVREYPESAYRQNSEMMIFNLQNSVFKDQTIAAQQTQLETLRREVQRKENEVVALQKQVKALEENLEAARQKLADRTLLEGSADRILIEKSRRRLTLLSQGELLKSYTIALGGNPVGPKERQGDHKTPEGIYTINGRNKNSRYHLSLRISYPNAEDKKRARKLGVSPGGNIMIHGLKNDSLWVGSNHSRIDWTEGCIAVTNDEIEEIARLTPDGTVVEIQP